MITEDYVSFETAKLLKEKGFDEKCMSYYGHGEFHLGNPKYMRSNTDRDGVACNGVPYDAYNAPTIQMAVKWLREKHNQNITVKAHNNVARAKTIYYAEVQNLSEPAEKGFCVNGCTFKDTYEEAVEYAIRYCLENLI